MFVLRNVCMSVCHISVFIFFINTLSIVLCFFRFSKSEEKDKFSFRSAWHFLLRFSVDSSHAMLSFNLLNRGSFFFLVISVVDAALLKAHFQNQLITPAPEEHTFVLV